MRPPSWAVAAVALAAARLLAASWRYRRVGRPPGSREPHDSDALVSRGRAAPLPPACYALWHEHQLPLAMYHAGQGVVVLVSRHRDGEILARALGRLGYGTARGSSTRGGASGLRRMVRAGRTGRALAFTPDGPRGPARRCKAGIVRAAASTGLPVVPVGVAASAAHRLRSWDRFLVPAPGSRIYVSYGPPIAVPADPNGELERWTTRVAEAIDREVRRCERAAEERSLTSVARSVLRGRAESRLRAAWMARPGPALRAAGAAFGLATDLRHLGYDAGVLRAWPAPLRLVSVGGLTVGGSGKTPVTAELASWLVGRGLSVAVLTHGYPDELALHRALLPEALVIGEPDRLRAASRAAGAGAQVAFLDDGFQHRRLARDLEIVLLDLDAILRTNLRQLPAGPFRERFAAVARADALIITRRSSRAEEAERLARWLRRRLPRVPVARLALEPGRLMPANRTAEAASKTKPTVALSGIMKPRLFFDQATRRCGGLTLRVALPDHGSPPPDLLADCVRTAGANGIVCTRKDVPRLAPALPPHVPLWYLEDRLRWEAEEAAIRAWVERVAAPSRLPAGRGEPGAPGRQGAGGDGLRCGS